MPSLLILFLLSAVGGLGIGGWLVFKRGSDLPWSHGEEIDALIQDLGEENAVKRSRAIERLAEIGSEAVRPLIGACKQMGSPNPFLPLAMDLGFPIDDPKARAQAGIAEALARIGDPAAVAVSEEAQKPAGNSWRDYWGGILSAIAARSKDPKVKALPNPKESAGEAARELDESREILQSWQAGDAHGLRLAMDHLDRALDLAKKGGDEDLVARIQEHRDFCFKNMKQAEGDTQATPESAEQQPQDGGSRREAMREYGEAREIVRSWSAGENTKLQLSLDHLDRALALAERAGDKDLVVRIQELRYLCLKNMKE